MSSNRYSPLTQNDFEDSFDQDSEDYVSLFFF